MRLMQVIQHPNFCRAVKRPVVAVLGANGRTGSLVVEACRCVSSCSNTVFFLAVLFSGQALLRDGLAIPRALTRSGSWKKLSEARKFCAFAICPKVIKTGVKADEVPNAEDVEVGEAGREQDLAEQSCKNTGPVG